MRNMFFLFGALLLVDGVFGVNVTLSVIEGDSLTLKPQTVIPEGKADSAQWYFGDLIIARINKAAGIFNTSEGEDERFKGHLNLDNQTGSLTITNTRTNHTGLYTLKISSRTETFEIFNVTVSGEMKTISEEGEYITLDTGLIGINGYDLIMWKFKNQTIAELNKGTNQFLTPDTSDERFKGRLKLHPQILSLIIGNSKITDSGDYHLNMNSSSHTVQRTISVTVSGSGLSPGVVAGIVGVGVVVIQLLVFAAAAVAGVIYIRRVISKLKRSKARTSKSGWAYTMLRKRTK